MEDTRWDTSHKVSRMGPSNFGAGKSLRSLSGLGVFATSSGASASTFGVGSPVMVTSSSTLSMPVGATISTQGAFGTSSSPMLGTTMGATTSSVMSSTQGAFVTTSRPVFGTSTTVSPSYCFHSFFL